MSEQTPFVQALVSIANSEFETFKGLKERSRKLRARIDEYCEAAGVEPPDDIGGFAWSAVFVSWCVKTAGATRSEFVFSERHAVFVKAAIANADAGSGVFRARPIDAYAPKPGDIIQRNREDGRVTYKQARTRSNYPSHSAIVVDIVMRASGKKFAVTIGGNESNAIGRREILLTSDGRVAQVEDEPYICVIENSKVSTGGVEAFGLKPELAAVRFGAVETFACDSGGEDSSPSLEATVEKPRVDRVFSSPNQSGRDGADIDHIVVHYTTSRNIDGSISHFMNGDTDNRTSAHYIVGQDGELVQLVPDSRRAWHAGKSQMNARSIGIEHVAARGDRITVAQAKTSLALIRWLMQEHNIPASQIIPHVCVKPTSCCGDLFRDFGGGFDFSCDKQLAAVRAWLTANGIGTVHEAQSELARFEATPAKMAGGFESISSEQRLAMAKVILDFEARRDRQGRLVVYDLPPGDGGGRYEVAGINERYHKAECDALVALIRAGNHEEAERRAIEFMANFTDKAAEWSDVPAIQFMLRDAMFNRGPGGSAKILQIALGVTADGRVGPQTLAALRRAENQPRQLIEKLTRAREEYERRFRDESSIFWRGLVNRWKHVRQHALSLVSGPESAIVQGRGRFEAYDGGTQLRRVIGIAPDPVMADLTEEVPFLDRQDSKAPSFDDLTGTSQVDDPAHMLHGIRAMRNGIPAGETMSEAEFEVAIGADTSLPSAFLEVMAQRRKAVAKISASGVDFRNRSGRWSGTGFLVAKNVLLTNHHVLNSIAVAQEAAVDFEFEVPPAEFMNGILEPQRDPAQEVRRYRLDPSRLFITSPASQDGLDYTFVWIEDEAETKYGAIQMHRAAFAVAPGEQAFVIHHPQGQGKRVSLDDTDVLRINANVIRYSSDTMQGSSGSPVFNRQGRLIALHHASQRDSTELPDGSITAALNEGIKIAAIVADLERRQAAGEGQMARQVLAAVHGSDTLAGFFGSLGRTREIAPGAAGAEAVVDVYRGTDQDVDIGFWNIEWLANRYHDPEKLRLAAFLIVDLGLDLWGLEEVSPPAVQALVRELDQRFGERYEYALSEPDAPESKQSTAVIWKARTLEGKRIEWPAEIERLWDLDSRDDLGFESVDGKIFNRYPGLFQFKVRKQGAPMKFYVVPLHLKAMDEGSKRRQLASKLLAHAVKLMIENHGAGKEWILGGDFNAALASTDFAALQQGDFVPMSATDEQAGAFSYIKSPKSLIDHVFLSQNLAQHTGGDSYFIVAKDKSVDSYARKLSDHRPVLVRLALGDGRLDRRSERANGDLDAAVDRIMRRVGGRSGSRQPAFAAPTTAFNPSDRRSVPAREDAYAGYAAEAGSFEAGEVRRPSNFFLFASEWRDLARELGIGVPSGESDDKIGVRVIDHIHGQRPQDRLLIGFDAGDPADPDSFPYAALQRAKDIGAELSIYVEGPGGPTDGVWSPDEKKRVRAAGKTVGIPDSLGFDAFLQRWHDGKWREFTFKQLKKFHDEGFTACEIDNLDQVLGDDDNAQGLLALLKRYRTAFDDNQLPRLILKNISEDRLETVVTAIRTGQLTRAMFAEFHIAEHGSGTPTQQTKAAEKIAIRTIFSHDTNRYTAYGRFALENKYDEVMGLAPAPDA